MPAIRKNLNINYLRRLYESGLSYANIGKLVHAHRETIRFCLRDAGVPPHPRKGSPRPLLRTSVPDNTIRRMYLAGRSEKYLSNRFKVSRSLIRRRLLDGGLDPRGRSASMFMRMAQTSQKERARLAHAAHDAVRGVRQSFEHRCKRALTREINQVAVGARNRS